MANVTIYTCDKCGKKGDCWEVPGTVITNSSLASPPSKSYYIAFELCIECLEKVHALVENFMKKE